MFEDKKVSFMSAPFDQFKTVQVAGLPQSEIQFVPIKIRAHTHRA